MATNYYNGFDVITVDANGFRQPAPGVTVRINAGAYTSVVSDAHGRVNAGSIAATTDGDIVTFDVSGSPGTMPRTLRPSAAAAETEQQNAIPTLVLENLGAEKQAVTVDFWAENTTNPDVVPQLLASGTPGTTIEVPFVTPTSVDLNIHSNPGYEDGSKKYLNWRFDPIEAITVDPTTGDGGGGGGGGTGFGSGVAGDPIFDAKGDLPVGTGADTAARLAVGTDGKVLTADSSQPTGLKWATPAGGTGDVAADTHAATGKTTPVDADEVPLIDSAASYALKKLTWANLKATLKTYFDTLYTGTQTITLTGDVTGSGTGSFAATIANAAVTLAKMANVATGTIFYRKTAGTGAPEVQTLATLKTDLALVKGDVGLGSVDNTADSAKPVSTAQAAADAAVQAYAIQRANHTGTQLAATVSDFNSAALVAAPAETASTLGATINGAAAATPNNTDLVATVESSVVKKITWTNVKAFLKTYFDTLYPSGSGTSSGTNTGDQTTVSGNAGTATALQTARNIDGQAFDGTANITVIAPGTHAATGKTTPVDADELAIVDSAASNVLKKLTWANLKATLKSYFDTLYPSGSGTSSGTNTGDQTSIVGISGTKAQFNTAVSDTDIIFANDLATNVAAFLADPTSAKMAAMVTDETGSGSNVFAVGPTLSKVLLAAGTATAGTAPIYFTPGTNLTTPEAGAQEFDGVNFYGTIDTTSGRGMIPVEQYFHLTAAGSNISTIGNFFGANSNIKLVASAYYEIDIYLFFTKNTAGVVTFTLTNSATPTSQNIIYEMSPVTGIVAPPGTATMLSGQFFNDATAAKAFSTASITNNANIYARFKIFLQNGTGTSLKIQATGNVTAGTITPGVGSFWFARRLSPNNIGSFAA